jgi:chromate reductase
MQKKILIITASSGKNLELAYSFEHKLKELGASASILNLVSLDLPLYTSANEKNFNCQEHLQPWLSQLLSTDSFVFLAPEYNGGIPPLMTNFLAWVSRSSKDWREFFNEKTAAIGTHSGGGGSHVLMALRMQLSYIGLNVLGRQIITHSQKPLDNQSLEAVARQLLNHSS